LRKNHQNKIEEIQQKNRLSVALRIARLIATHRVASRSLRLSHAPGVTPPWGVIYISTIVLELYHEFLGVFLIPQ
jgi:hypothetical protein